MLRCYFTLLLFCFSANSFSQKISPELKNHLENYFKNLPYDKNFVQWISSIENDPSIKIDTIISKSSTDTLIYFVQGKFLNFHPFHLPAAETEFFIRVNKLHGLRTDTVMQFRVSVTIDSSATNKKLLKEEYKRLNKEFHRFYVFGKEELQTSGNGKYSTVAMYFLDISEPASLYISRGRSYKPAKYGIGLLISLKLF
jgi:hypothetical protein